MVRVFFYLLSCYHNVQATQLISLNVLENKVTADNSSEHTRNAKGDASRPDRGVSKENESPPAQGADVNPGKWMDNCIVLADTALNSFILGCLESVGTAESSSKPTRNVNDDTSGLDQGVSNDIESPSAQAADANPGEQMTYDHLLVYFLADY